MNPDRAVQYLEEGLPDAGGEDAVMEDEGGEDAVAVPSTWPELVANPQFRAEVCGIADQAQLQAYLQSLSTTNPAKLALIQANPSAFAELLNQAQNNGGSLPPVAAAGGAPSP